MLLAMLETFLDAAHAEPRLQELLLADPLSAFLHQVQGDEELRGALAEARDAAAEELV